MSKESLKKILALATISFVAVTALSASEASTTSSADIDINPVLELNGETVVELDMDSNTKSYVFVAPEAGNLRVEASSQSMSVDPIVTLKDKSEKTLAFNDDFNNKTSESVIYLNLPKGIYTVEISQFGVGSGSIDVNTMYIPNVQDSITDNRPITDLTTITIDAENVNEIEIPASTRYIKVNGEINIDGEFNKFDSLQNVTILGGTFNANSSSSIKVGANTKFIGTTFKGDLTIGTTGTVYEKCTFKDSSNLHLGWESEVYDSNIINVVSDINAKFKVIAGSEIKNSTVRRAIEIRNSKIRDSKLGELTSQLMKVNNIVNNSFDDSEVNYLYSGGVTIVGNSFENSYIKIEKMSDFTTISGNKFEDFTNPVLNITTASSWHLATVSSNSFFGDSYSTSKAISIDGSHASYGFINITDNLFQRVKYPVSYSGSGKVLFGDNTLRSVGNIPQSSSNRHFIVDNNKQL